MGGGQGIAIIMEKCWETARIRRITTEEWPTFSCTVHSNVKSNTADIFKRDIFPHFHENMSTKHFNPIWLYICILTIRLSILFRLELPDKSSKHSLIILLSQRCKSLFIHVPKIKSSVLGDGKMCCILELQCVLRVRLDGTGICLKIFSINQSVCHGLIKKHQQNKTLPVVAKITNWFCTSVSKISLFWKSYEEKASDF